MSEEWRHPTMADAGFVVEVRCICRRVKHPKDMYDVRTLGVGQTYLCDPCVQDHLRVGTFDHLTLHRRAGAPEAFLTMMEAKLRAGPLLRIGLPQEIWGEKLAAAIEGKLPAELSWETQLALQALEAAALAEQELLAGEVTPVQDSPEPLP